MNVRGIKLLLWLQEWLPVIIGGMKVGLFAAGMICLLAGARMFQTVTTLAEISAETIGAAHQVMNTNSIKAGAVLDKAKEDLTDLNRVVLSIGGTSGIIRKAAQAQADYWNKNGEQSVELFRKANVAAEGLNQTLGQATKTLAAVEDTTKRLQGPIDSVNRIVVDADKIVGDPNIPKVIDNANGILADGKKVADRFAAPVTTAKKVSTFIWNSFLHWVK